MMNLLSKTSLGRSGHVRFQTFGPIWHVSGPEMVFWRNDTLILHHFSWRSSKIKLFWPKTLIFYQKTKKYPKRSQKIAFIWALVRVTLDVSSGFSGFQDQLLSRLGQVSSGYTGVQDLSSGCPGRLALPKGPVWAYMVPYGPL